MAKLKSKIPLRRPHSDERSSKPSRSLVGQADLRRISSDLSKPKNRNSEADDNSVHSLDVNSNNLRVRRFTVTIKDSKGEFVKRRKSYRLTYNQDNDAGDEYEIEKESVSDTSAKEFNDTHNVLQDLSNNDSAFYTAEHPGPFSPDQSRNDEDDLNVTVADNFTTYESEKSQTVFTDDTSIPIFDDESSESNAAFGDKFARESSVPSQLFSPVSGTTIRLLTPQDRNERNILFQDRPFRKIAKVSKAGTFISSDKNAPISDNNDPVLKSVNDTDTVLMSKEGTSTSLPPKNFKANLFNRIRMVSTPRRTPKFSPILHPSYRKEKSPTIPGLVPSAAENTFVKDTSTGRLKPIMSPAAAAIQPGGQNNSNNTDTKDRYELVDLDKAGFTLKPKRHRRSIDTNKSEGNNKQISNLPIRIDRLSNAQRNQISGTGSQSAILNKPVLKHSTTTSLQHRPQGNTLLKTNHVIESSANDIFSEEDKRLRLRQAQYINDDLRIVKTKLQDNDFVALHIDTKLRETIQKKNVLSQLNKTTTVKDNETPDFPQRPLLAKALVPKHDNKMIIKPHVKPTNVDLRNRLIEKRNVLPEIKNKRNSLSSDTNASTQLSKDQSHKRNTWQVQPKIHRFNSNKVRSVGKRKDANPATKHSSKNSNVAAWLLNSARGANRTEARRKNPPKGKITFQKNRRVLNQKMKFMHWQDKQRKQRQEQERKETKSQEVKTDSYASLLNQGFYLPLGKKKLKRQPMRLKPRLYTQVGKVKGYESEIPVLDCDSDVDEPMYDGPRPLTDTAREFRTFRDTRYEGEYDKVVRYYRKPPPAHQKGSKVPLVKILCNGDQLNPGLTLSINKGLKSFTALLDRLTDNFKTRIDRIYSIPYLTEVTSLKEFVDRRAYVATSKTKGVKGKFTYGMSGAWVTSKVKDGRRNDEIELYKKDIDFKDSHVGYMPMVINVSYNLARDDRETIILNPQTTQDFDSWVDDLSKQNLPVRALYSDRPPYLQMKSFTHIFREHQLNNNNFIACGEEMKPSELKKRQAPSSNSSTDSIGDSKNRKKKSQKQQDMGQIIENGSPDSSISTSMSRSDNGMSKIRGRNKNSRQRDIAAGQCVLVDVNGTPKEFYPPSTKDPKDDGAKPRSLLKCDWVYGFRGRETKHNLQVLRTEELVYYVGAIVVIYDKESDTQRHYTKHTEEVTCIAVHSDGITVATGQMHGKKVESWAHIQIWDGDSLNTLQVIGLNTFTHTVISVGFSKDKRGKYLCVLDSSSKHMLSVWDWKNDRFICRTTTTLADVHCACFYPDGANNSIMITYGVRHIYFWKIFFDIARKTEAKLFRDRYSGVFESEVPNSINCVAFLPSGEVATGDSSGNVMIWARDPSEAFVCMKTILAHDGAITAMVYMDEDKERLLTASTNEIKAWDVKDFTVIETKQIPPCAGDIMTLVPLKPRGAGGRLYTGTTNNAILEGSMKHKFKYLVQGHYYAINCVASHEIEPTFFSAGEDGIVYKWGMINHKVIWRTNIGSPCTALATMSKTDMTKNKKLFDIVTVGTVLGKIHILHAFNGMTIATVNICDVPIGCLSFSFDETSLAVGCNDGSVLIYEMPDRKTLVKVNVSAICHNDGVANLDWSVDGRCIQSSSYANELLFWNTDTMEPIDSPASVRNVEWLTINCPMAYSLIGPWSNMGKRETLKVASRSPKKDLCAIGDSYGRVRLYKYPCTREKADFRNIRVYSSDVISVAFTADDSGLITCGGYDAGLVQWEISEDSVQRL